MVKEDLWSNVEEYLAESSPAGYNMAIIEADKILRHVLKTKGYPGKDLKRQILWAGWKMEDKNPLVSAIQLKDKILTKFDYKLTSLDAEEAVKEYKNAIKHFNEYKKLTFTKKLGLYYSHKLH